MRPGSGPGFVSERLDEPRHVTAAFNCGEPALNSWLVQHAAHAGKMNTARTFVWTVPGGTNVVAYYAACAHLLQRADAPNNVGRGAPEIIPAVLLAKLALDTKLHGRGLGAELLWDALSRLVGLNQEVAARAVVVDALHEPAAAFYARYGFRPTPENPLRLVQKMSDIERAIG